MLEIIVAPRLAPAMLCKGIDASPDRDDQRIKEFLASSGPAKPVLPNEKDNGEQDTVRNESAAHDEMSQTLPKMVRMAKSQRRYPSKQHLYPSHERHGLPHNPVERHHVRPYTTLKALLEVKLQIYAQTQLDHEHKHQGVCERGMDIRCELTALVSVTQEKGDDGNDASNDLYGDVPARSNDLL
jgi:hypothetical protein